MSMLKLIVFEFLFSTFLCGGVAVEKWAVDLTDGGVAR